jgi:uncharacterized protein YkwD
MSNGTLALAQNPAGMGVPGQAIGSVAGTQTPATPSEVTNTQQSDDSGSAKKAQSDGGDSNKKSSPDATKKPSADASSAAKKAPAKAKASYVKEEPQADPAGSPTRVHRPGTEATMPPTAPTPGSSNPKSPMPLLTPPPAAPPREKYPSVGQLEQLMFGHSTPNIIVDNRLDKLETAIFQKNYPDLDIEQRIRRLKDVIVGEEAPKQQTAGGAPYADPDRTLYPAQSPTTFSPKNLGMTLPDLDKDPAPQAPFFPNYGHYDLNQQLSIDDAEKFGVDVINEVRQQQGLNELSWDDKSFKVASEQIGDLVKRDAVSHQNSKGENPDLRYTLAGGTDSMVESTMMFPSADKLRPTRQLVVKMLETLYSRQDDREALMYAHATGFSMAFQWSKDHQKLVWLTEVTTKHGQMEPIPLEATVGDKIDVRGAVGAPYKFQKITLAWEGLSSSPPDDASEETEALPYFPPLDYEAHAVKSNKDYDKGIRVLQFAGITAAIAGGLFIPPVALAAPLIAASIGPSTPKAVSEIPVKGGVKTDGSNFSRSLVLSNQGKEGIYYVTIWANTGAADEAVAVSRRAIIARKDHPSTDTGASKDEPKQEPVKTELKIEPKDESKTETKKDADTKQAQPES